MHGLSRMRDRPVSDAGDAAAIAGLVAIDRAAGLALPGIAGHTVTARISTHPSRLYDM
jgi:hypothetical protein